VFVFVPREFQLLTQVFQLRPQVFFIMKQKGRRRDHFGGRARNRETTRDERVKIIALRESGMTWKEIGRQLEIDYRTCQGIFRKAQVGVSYPAHGQWQLLQFTGSKLLTVRTGKWNT
jgi:hypothetical protein